MKSKQLGKPTTHVVRLKKGEEVITSIQEFAEKNDLGFCSVQLIGAVEDVTLGYLKLSDPENEVIKNKFTGSHEFLAHGNLSLKDGKPHAHIHAFIGKPNKELRGGHLVSAKVSVTMEAIIQEFEHKINRKTDPEIKYPILNV